MGETENRCPTCNSRVREARGLLNAGHGARPNSGNYLCMDEWHEASIKTGPVTTPVRDVGKPDKTPHIFKNDAEAVAAIIKQVRGECNCYKATRLHHLPDCPAYVPEPLTSPTSTDELAHDELCRLSRVFNYHHSTMPVHAEDERIRQWLHTKIARSKR
jgi:hypothetical protein